MEALIIWPIFFVAIGLAISFGFYSMADPSRDVRKEYYAFGASLGFGVTCAALICLIVGDWDDAVEILCLVCLPVLAGTLTGAIPRMIFQVQQNKHWSLGFLFRLLAYSAVLIVLGKSLEWNKLVIVPCVFVLALCFFLYLRFARFRQLNWQALALLILVNCCFGVATVTVLEFHNSNVLSDNLLQGFMPWTDADSLGQVLGVQCFGLFCLYVHRFKSGESLSTLATDTIAADNQDSGEQQPFVPSGQEPDNDDAIFQ